MKYFFTLIFALLVVCRANSQKQHEKEIKVIDSLLDLSWYETTKVNTGKSLEYAIDAVSLSEKINHSESKAWAYFFTGQALTGLSSYKDALKYLSLAEKEKYTATNPQLLAEICRVRGRVYGHMGFKDHSVQEFKKGISHINKLQDKNKINQYTGLIYENLSYYYHSKNLWDSVFYYGNKNREVLTGMEESLVYGNWLNLYNLLGEIHSRNQKYDSAAYYFNQSISISEKYNYLYVSKTYTNWGRMETEIGNHDLALDYYFKALNNLKVTGLKNELPYVYKEMVNIYQIKEIPDSVEYYNKKMIVIENELSKEKLEAAEQASNIILNKEKQIHREKRNSLLLYIGFIGLVVIVILGRLLFYKIQHKGKVRELKIKEKESQLLTQKLNRSLGEVAELAKNNDPLFLTRFKEAYPEFVNKLLTTHPDLNNSELSLCAMIYFNFTSKEISRYTYIEHRSVQTKKNRLRRKMNLPAGTDLYNYFKTLTE